MNLEHFKFFGNRSHSNLRKYVYLTYYSSRVFTCIVLSITYIIRLCFTYHLIKTLNSILKLTNWCSWLGARFDSKMLLTESVRPDWFIRQFP